MKKILIGAVAVVIAMGFAYTAKAQQEDLKIKAKEVQTKQGTEIKVTGSGQDTESKTKVSGTVKEGQREATVVKEAKGTQPVLQRKVQFQSYDRGTDTVTVIQEKKLVRYPTRNLDAKRPYVLKWEKNKPVTITSTYDPKLGKDVVIDAAVTPLQEPAEQSPAQGK